jgi:hypothetical protein
MKKTVRVKFLWLLLAPLLMSTPLVCFATSGDEHWDPGFGLRDFDAGLLPVITDGTNVYFGGQFNAAGSTIASRVAKWDGQSWSALGNGIDFPGLVYALALQGTNLYVGGAFTSAGGVPATNIARWDGSQWWPVGTGVSGQLVKSFAFFNGELYAGGTFTNAGGIPATNIAKWNGSSWSGVGGGVTCPTNPIVFTLFVDGTDLYAGGTFTNAGGVQVSNVAKWNGSSWSALGTGLGTGNGSDGVGAFIKWNGTLYAGGTFGLGGGPSGSSVARWDGSTWSLLGSNFPTNGAVYSLVLLGTNLYAGGRFSNSVVAWNGSTWTPVGSGFSGGFGLTTAYSLVATTDGTLYAGGIFDTAGGAVVNNAARWNGSTWSALDDGHGPNNLVSALLINSSGLYAAGRFTIIGDIVANHIALWDGLRWHTLGTPGQDGIVTSNGFVNALAYDGQYLYAGGTFKNAGGVFATNIARWDGTNWSALGTGLDTNVSALACSGGVLYAGGTFSRAGAITVNHAAQWNGSSWAAMGAGMNTNVLTLSASPNGVYAGGSFTTADGATANHIAKWSGLGWASLGSTSSTNGVNGNVNAIIQVAPTTIIVGGSFTSAEGALATNIVSWGSGGWAPLGSGLKGAAGSSVSALVANGTDIYAGGNFTNASVTTLRVAKWDGTNWSALGSGLTRTFGSGSTVTALAMNANDLYLGGTFTVAGGKASFDFAHWNALKNFDIPGVLQLGNPRLLSGDSFLFNLASTNVINYVVEASTNLQNWLPLATNPASTTVFKDTNAPSFGARYYRARESQ